ncbi:hypothetical protein [Streptomyces sp. NPDC058086]|uniref:hypothetical protein n=1 Tax=Streptomyces sp. NPDC058086 TaxID=3346334 RepID=UPI0036EF3B49
MDRNISDRRERQHEERVALPLPVGAWIRRMHRAVGTRWAGSARRVERHGLEVERHGLEGEQS